MTPAGLVVRILSGEAFGADDLGDMAGRVPGIAAAKVVEAPFLVDLARGAEDEAVDEAVLVLDGRELIFGVVDEFVSRAGPEYGPRVGSSPILEVDVVVAILKACDVAFRVVRQRTLIAVGFGYLDDAASGITIEVSRVAVGIRRGALAAEPVVAPEGNCLIRRGEAREILRRIVAEVSVLPEGIGDGDELGAVPVELGALLERIGPPDESSVLVVAPAPLPPSCRRRELLESLVVFERKFGAFGVDGLSPDCPRSSYSLSVSAPFGSVSFVFWSARVLVFVLGCGTVGIEDGDDLAEVVELIERDVAERVLDEGALIRRVVGDDVVVDAPVAPGADALGGGVDAVVLEVEGEAVLVGFFDQQVLDVLVAIGVAEGVHGLDEIARRVIAIDSRRCGRCRRCR